MRLQIVHLTKDHVEKHLAHYIAVSADVSPWREAQFLLDLPDKWKLSLALWQDHPLAYCIMSRKLEAVHIHQFMVAPNHRGSGIGRQMLDSAKEIATTVCNRITLKTPKLSIQAQRFYLKNGFSIYADEGEYIQMQAFLSKANL